MPIRLRATTVLIAVLAGTPVLLARQSPAPWPPPGVYTFRDIDTAPRAVKQPRPDYTAEATRLGISGTVVLEAVVQPDGSVGPIRVARSLDTLHGLDDAAIAALKQWEFSPGVKDGKPVAVLVTVELSFTTSGQRSLPWPAGFEGPTRGGPWKTADVETERALLHIEYPETWTLGRDSSQQVVRLETTGATATVTTTPSAGDSFTRPFAGDQLKSIVDRMNAGARAFGQVAAGGRIWVWTESAAPNGASTWWFQTVADDVEIDARMSQPLRRDELTAEFGAIVRRLAIKPR